MGPIRPCSSHRHWAAGGPFWDWLTSWAICIGLPSDLGDYSDGGYILPPLTIGQPAPEIAGAPWINSPPLTLAALRGRVVLIDFWTNG